MRPPNFLANSRSACRIDHLPSHLLCQFCVSCGRSIRRIGEHAPSEYDGQTRYLLPDLIDRALRIDIREAKLFGLDAPTKSEVSGPEGKPLSVLASVDGQDLKRRLDENLTIDEQGMFITLLNKIEGRGVYETVETTATQVPEQPAITDDVTCPTCERKKTEEPK